MAAVNDAKSLRKKEDELNDLAVAYGVQQNLLIALKNLNENPPLDSFDIGLPPFNHQSHLWNTDEKDNGLHLLATELGMELIANDSIELHVFHRMYNHLNALQILNQTIGELIGRGFGIHFHSLFGFKHTLEDGNMELQKSIELYIREATVESQEISLDNQERSINHQERNIDNLDNLEMLLGSVTMICSEKEIPNFSSYERAPVDLSFIPNMGLTITF